MEQPAAALEPPQLAVKSRIQTRPEDGLARRRTIAATGLRQARGHERPRRTPADEPAFRDQLLDRAHHRLTVNAQCPRERSGAGETVARSQPSPLNLVHQRIRDLTPVRDSAGSIDLEHELPSRHAQPLLSSELAQQE
jgi:hypothetical protein